LTLYMKMISGSSQFTVIRNMSKMGLNLDSVSRASPSPPILHPIGGHPWTGLTSRPEGVITTMGVWQGVTMDSLKYHLGPPCPTLLRTAGRPPLKRPYGGAGSLRPSSTLLDTQRRTPMITTHKMSGQVVPSSPSLRFP